jgi:DNA-binding transcriptional LysR family regulator
MSAHHDNRIERVLAKDIEARRTYWLVMHTDLQRLPRIRAVISFIENLICRMEGDF